VTTSPHQAANPQELEQLFHTLVENSLTAIYILQDGRVVYANPQMALLMGYSRESLEAGEIPLLTMVAEEDRLLVQESVRRRLAGEEKQAHYRFKARHRDGHAIPVEVFSSLTQFRAGRRCWRHCWT